MSSKDKGEIRGLFSCYTRGGIKMASRPQTAAPSARSIESWWKVWSKNPCPPPSAVCTQMLCVFIRGCAYGGQTLISHVFPLLLSTVFGRVGGVGDGGRESSSMNLELAVLAELTDRQDPDIPPECSLPTWPSTGLTDMHHGTWLFV